jgi:electron transfer flavoprotein alpha subunit
MNKDIWVYMEPIEGKISDLSLEMLGEAFKLQNKMKAPGKVIAFVLGDNPEETINEVAEYGVDKIYIANHPKLAIYQPEYYSQVFAKQIAKEDPHIILIGASAVGTQLAPTIGGKVRAGVAAHCIELKLDEEDNMISVVPAFGGKVLGDILWPTSRPQMASVKAGIFEKAEKKAFTGEKVDLDISFLDSLESSLKPVSVCREPVKGVPLETAEVVICGGWGVGDQEHWTMLEKLAERLGGAISCTRPPIDEGWAPGEHMMIGTSGKSIKPKFYLGFGISGATHHVCGMKDSGLIISVNKDENAEMFSASDYAIVADVKKIVPALCEALGVEK